MKQISNLAITAYSFKGGVIFVYSVISSLVCTSLKLLVLLSAKLNFRIPSFSINLSHFRLFQTLNKHVLILAGHPHCSPLTRQGYATRHMLFTKIWCDGGTRTHDLLLKRQIKH